MNRFMSSLVMSSYTASLFIQACVGAIRYPTVLLINNLDIKKAKSIDLDERVPYVELSSMVTPDDMVALGIEDTITKVDNMPSPRVIKTHLSIDMLPKEVHTKKAKVIYVCRNPRDVVVSYFNFLKLDGYYGSLDVFFEAFIGNVLSYSPFLQHVRGYWDKRNDNNILFTSYEEMKKVFSKMSQKREKEKK